MTLEESYRIDIVTKTDEGKISLVITDAGLTTDPQERFAKLIAKLKAYVGYVMGKSFQDDHPGMSTQDVMIVVMCKTPPTEQMQEITQVTPSGDPHNSIPVVFQVFAGKDG